MVLEIKRTTVASWFTACYKGVKILKIHVLFIEIVQELDFGMDTRFEVVIAVDVHESFIDVKLHIHF